MVSTPLILLEIQKSVERITAMSNRNSNTYTLPNVNESSTANNNQNLSEEDLKKANILNKFDKRQARGAWTGGNLVRSGGCVETSLTAMQYLQRELGVASGGNLIGNLPVVEKTELDPTTGKQSKTRLLAGQRIQDLQAAFDRGDIKVGDIITTTTSANLNRSVHELAAGGKGLNNHAAIVTAVLNPTTGKYEVRLIDNDSKTAKSSTVQEYVEFIGSYSPLIHSIQRPNYTQIRDNTNIAQSNNNRSLGRG